jgi:transcriptional regulator with XRE-family HTH domain
MPKTLAERMREIRTAAGFGGPRQAAAFAKLIGIKPPSLHDIESGKTSAFSARTVIGLLKIGVSPRFIWEGKGQPMQKKEVEAQLKSETLHSMIDELDEAETDMITDVVKAYIRRKSGSSPNDPFKKDPPKGGGTQ